MYVSAVICTHNLNNYQNLVEALRSLLEQTYQEREIIVVVDGNAELFERLTLDYRENAVVRAILLKDNAGVSEARNTGIRVARGDVIAFMDDDAIASSEWMETLVATYKSFDAVAVGGRILPIWTEGEPQYLPEELYWLIGVTHKGFAEDKISEIRNTFGPNMSFKREVFETIGSFNKDLGFSKRSGAYLQAEEPDMALRMKQAFGKGVMYNPEAVVYHKVPLAKLRVGVLVKRSFFQGYSKAILRRMNKSVTGHAMDVEKHYLKAMLIKNIPQRMKRAYHLSELKKAAMLIASIISVGLGFVYGSLKKVQLPYTQGVDNPVTKSSPH
jgi:glucosyl-dolichyl phosphate glucuronosyltransferase